MRSAPRLRRDPPTRTPLSRPADACTTVGSAVQCRAVRAWQVTLIELTVLELVRTLIVSEHSNFGVAAYSFYPCARDAYTALMITVIMILIVIYNGSSGYNDWF